MGEEEGRVTYDEEARAGRNGNEECSKDVEEYASTGDDKIFEGGAESELRSEDGVYTGENYNEDEEIGYRAQWNEETRL